MRTDQAEGGPHRYLALDALRGVAAFAVLFYHLRNLKGAIHHVDGFAVFASGYLAVDLFFVLSGFVISHAYAQRLQSSLSFRDFMIARFVRLQPVIAVGTVMGLGTALAQRSLGIDSAPGLFAIVTSLVPNLLLLPNIAVPWGIFLLNPPAWSLFYELLANALYALGFKARPAARRVSVDLALGAICMVGFAGLLASIVIGGDLDRGVVLTDWPVASARITFSFTLGLLLHRKRPSWSRRLPTVAMPWLLLACASLLAPMLDGPVRALYDLVFVAMLSPLLVMLTALTQPAPRLRSFAAWLGMISFPLYAVHAPIKHIVETALFTDFATMFASAFCMAVLAAWVVGSTIDPALRRLLAALLRLASKRRIGAEQPAHASVALEP